MHSVDPSRTEAGHKFNLSEHGLQLAQLAHAHGVPFEDLSGNKTAAPKVPVQNIYRKESQ